MAISTHGLDGEVTHQWFRSLVRLRRYTPPFAAACDILKPGERAIKRAGAEVHARELLDVLGDGVAVLRSVGQAGEHQ